MSVTFTPEEQGVIWSALATARTRLESDRGVLKKNLGLDGYETIEDRHDSVAGKMALVFSESTKEVSRGG